MSKTPLAVVTSFCAAWSKLDIDEMIGYFHADAVYHNIPVDPIQGRDTIKEMIVGFSAGWDRVDFEIRHTVATGTSCSPRGWTTSSPRSAREPARHGTFEFAGGLITAWRDYFDLNQFMNQLTLITVRHG